MWTNQSDFLKILRENNVRMYKSRANNTYYINVKQKAKTVLFDIDMLDVVKEDKVIAANETGLLEVGGELCETVNLK